MNDLLYNQYIRNITTPINGVTNQHQGNIKSTGVNEDGLTFAEVLSNQISQNSNIEFSRHAINRVVERNIDISTNTIDRLNEGVKLAEEKGLNNTLILVDSTAFVVNVQNNKVITTVNQESLKGNVFTNIDGTVII